jgi:hypothetical protein
MMLISISRDMITTHMHANLDERISPIAAWYYFEEVREKSKVEGSYPFN